MLPGASINGIKRIVSNANYITPLLFPLIPDLVQNHVLGVFMHFPKISDHTVLIASSC